ncbi:MAG: beta-Ala-His dipeptidase [Spirochaetales bacterium]|nr:beta-Ala-His dipeptidase [Spirochaetales bacterium]
MTVEDVLLEFTALSAVPRCSGHEKAAAEFIARQAQAAGCSYRTDQAGNIAVFVPPTGGMEEVPGVILQGHLDMVCVRDSGSSHDFKKDPIVPQRQGDWVTAAGTTLGADNGVAVALALAVMKDGSLSHGPLELLFTVEEETGLIGASNLGDGMIEGAYLINLDFEEDYQICVGCAGGVILKADGVLPVETVTAAGLTAWTIAADGLKGGHSGMDIGGSPENLYKAFARLLRELETLDARITGITGDGKSNAIPTNCSVNFLLPEGREEDLRQIFHRFEETFYGTYAHPEVNPHVALKNSVTEKDQAITREGTADLVRLLEDLPSGVMERHEDMGGLVSTSANPGVLQVGADGSVHLEINHRSDRAERLQDVEVVILGCLKAAGLSVTDRVAFPPWPPAPASALVSLCQDCRRGIYAEPAEVVTIHAGLECGILSAKAGGLDSISIGPNQFDVHTTRERIQVSSVEKFIRWLEAILARQGELR